MYTSSQLIPTLIPAGGPATGRNENETSCTLTGHEGSFLWNPRFCRAHVGAVALELARGCFGRVTARQGGGTTAGRNAATGGRGRPERGDRDRATRESQGRTSYRSAGRGRCGCCGGGGVRKDDSRKTPRYPALRIHQSPPQSAAPPPRAVADSMGAGLRRPDHRRHHHANRRGHGYRTDTPPGKGLHRALRHCGVAVAAACRTGGRVGREDPGWTRCR